MKKEDKYEDCGFNQGDTIEFRLPNSDKIKKGVVVGRSSTEDMAGQKPWFTVNVGKKKVKYMTIHKSQIIGTVE